MSFHGKTVLVTGAAGVVGRAVARRFADHGASLVLADVSGAALREAYPTFTGNQQHLLVAVDLLAAGDLTRELAPVPRIDVVCNIVGGFEMGPAVHETDDALWMRMMDMNARSLLCTARAVVPGMLAQGEGSIVNVGASAGLRGGAGMGAYSASKSAVLRLTESMSAELKDRGIRVNCVLPSIVDTPRNRKDMPGADPARWAAPDALADVIAFLASPASRAIHGACIPVTHLS